MDGENIADETSWMGVILVLLPFAVALVVIGIATAGVLPGWGVGLTVAGLGVLFVRGARVLAGYVVRESRLASADPNSRYDPDEDPLTEFVRHDERLPILLFVPGLVVGGYSLIAAGLVAAVVSAFVA